MSEIRHHIVEGKSILLWLPDMDNPKKLNASTIRSNHPRFDEIVAATRDGDIETVRNMVDVKSVITKLSVGRVEIRGDGVYYDGNRQGGLIADRIVYLAQQGADKVAYLMRFMERLSKSPHYHVKNGDLFGFIDSCTLPLTEDGCFMAFKYITNDWLDQHSRKFDNSVGSIVEMPRNEVCDDRMQECQPGLHVCSREYLGNSSRSNCRLIAVKIAPEDVVCVPIRYCNSKLRVCRYEVVQELVDWNFDALPEHIIPAKVPAAPVAEAAPTYETNTVPLAEPEPEPVIANVPKVEETTKGPDYSQKMDAKKVRDFRRLHRQVEQGTMSLKALCKQFGISPRNGARIRDYEIWPDVKP